MEMKQRTDLQDKVTQQLKNTILDNLSNVFTNESSDVSLIYSNLERSRFISISPPLEESPMMSFLTMDSLQDYKDGSSIKPGNISLNIWKLIEAIPEVVSIGAGMVCDNHIVTVCGALTLWCKLMDIVTINISKEQAFVIVALWKKCEPNHKISLDAGYTATNDLLKQYGEFEITSLKYNMIIDSLVKIKCIELTGGIIGLREWISKKYIDKI